MERTFDDSEEAKDLHLYAHTSDQGINKCVRSSLTLMKSHIDRVARDLAKSRADWMDDPTDERYEFWHSPAEVQFDEIDRLLVIRQLVNDQIDQLIIEAEARQ